METNVTSVTSKIAGALAKAQAKFQPPTKNKIVTVRPKTAPPYSFKYADIEAIVEAVRGPLSENEIAFTHIIEPWGGGLALKTRLIHSSGEMLESIYPLPRTDNPKDLGGAITYGKRYCLSAITGCVADDDADVEPENVTSFTDTHPKPAHFPVDDAIPDWDPPATVRSTVKPNFVPPKSESPPNQAIGTPTQVSQAQLKRMFAIAEGKWTHEQIKLYLDRRWGIASSKDLTLDQYNELVGLIETVPYYSALIEDFKEG